MRLITDKNKKFKNSLLKVGDGKFLNKFERENEVVRIDNDIICKDDIITDIYGNTINSDDESIHEKVILAPRNTDVFELNNEVLQRMIGESKEYLGIDNSDEENSISSVLPTEFLNSLTPNGLPTYKLTLKIGSIVILLRNINIDGGLCNGTRLKVIKMNEFSLCGKIITGNCAGKIVILPRITLSPSNEEIPFNMTRKQFPVILGFALTINKSQGQSFKKVGIYLPSSVFSHGQFYVAVSRVNAKQNLKIYLNKNSKTERKNETKNESEIYTKNLVYTEVLN